MRIEKRPAKKAKNGYTYRVKIDYIDEYGFKQTYSKSGFATKKEAREHGFEIEHELKNGTLKKKCTKTLSDCFLEKIDLEKNRLARSTIIQQTRIFKNHIAGEKIANVPISSLSYTMLQKYFNDLSGLSEGLVKVHRTIFSKAFKHALKCGYITENPMHDIDLSYTKSTEETHVISFDELESIIDHFLDMRSSFNKYSYCIIAYCGYYLGLRISEILALEKSDFDLRRGVVTVSKKLELNELKKREMYITERMKTKASAAVLPVPDPLKKILEEWFDFDPYDLVCPDKDGDFISSAAFRFACRSIGKKMGFKFHPHCLRHTFVTNVVRSGVDVKTASKLARHSDVQTTLDIYTHTDDNAKKDAIDRVFGKSDTNFAPDPKYFN